ncbi:MAG: hypothetical protein HOL33_09595 [Tateyamaria sp.]|jgi:hypothetical protein|nr:hypothetical protein [Tateyamaria sp.]MDA9224139.1 hypothetical protein [Tateyamaria sp.]
MQFRSIQFLTEMRSMAILALPFGQKVIDRNEIKAEGTNHDSIWSKLAH